MCPCWATSLGRCRSITVRIPSAPKAATSPADVPRLASESERKNRPDRTTFPLLVTVPPRSRKLKMVVNTRLRDPVHPAVGVLRGATLDVDEISAQTRGESARLTAVDGDRLGVRASESNRRDHRRGAAGERLAQVTGRS